MVMNFKVAPDPFERLSLLDDLMRFEPAGSTPTTESDSQHSHRPVFQPHSIPKEKGENQGLRKRAPKPLPCISEVSTPKGTKPVLKSMMTTACERNCFYCPFRAGRTKTKRITFSPDEMATTFDQMQQRGHVDGLFLSSGIIKGGVTAQDKIIETAEIIRRKQRYSGYIHLKIMPGAELEQIRQAMQLADRVSINLEAPTEQRLEMLAPQKNYWDELFTRINWISQLRQREELRASVVTQFVVGAVGDTDLELLSLSDRLFNQLGLKRAYFSSFHPISQTPLENNEASPLRREFRLYQSSFLLRDYGWDLEDLPFAADANLPLNVDPKQAWADAHLRNAPVELNSAERSQLLRVPGIGPKNADAILRGRRRGKLSEINHLKQLGIRNAEKASPYILLNGGRPMQQLSLF